MKIGLIPADRETASSNLAAVLSLMTPPINPSDYLPKPVTIITIASIPPQASDTPTLKLILGKSGMVMTTSQPMNLGALSLEASEAFITSIITGPSSAEHLRVSALPM
jgi:hypothetical protein